MGYGLPVIAPQTGRGLLLSFPTLGATLNSGPGQSHAAALRNTDPALIDRLPRDKQHVGHRVETQTQRVGVIKNLPQTKAQLARFTHRREALNFHRDNVILSNEPRQIKLRKYLHLCGATANADTHRVR